MDYPGKVITKNQVTPTQTSATGVWTLDDAAAATKNNTWPVAGVPNPISKSLRFNSADNAYLNRTPGVAGNRRTWTWSGWVKRSALGSAQSLLSVNATSDYTNFRFSSSDILQFYLDVDALNYAVEVPTVVWRDPSAWYHIVLAVDTTQATAGNRVKIYVNSVQQTVSAISGFSIPAQNFDTDVNSTLPHAIGVFNYNSTAYFNGYLTEINLIDGQALTPSSFGMTDPQTGSWEPIKYTGTYGTNGYYLNFKDATSTTTLGYDYSGNGNNWTTNNFSVTAGAGNDSLTDVPTPWIAYNTTGDVGGVVRGNYATWNPLENGSATFVQGNLRVTTSTTSGKRSVGSTILVSSGSWYTEVECVTNGSSSAAIGIANTSFVIGSEIGANCYAYYNDGTKIINGSSSAYGASYTSGDTIGIAFDATNGTITFYKNGTSQGQITSIPAGTYRIAVAGNSSVTASTFEANFGQRPFAYTPPAGFLSLCTTNLPNPTIGFGLTNQGDDYFNATTYTGTGSSLTVTNSGSMQPDLVWIKTRSTSSRNTIFDAIRGTNKILWSDSTDAEGTANAGTGLTAFASNGFTLGTEIAGTSGSVNTNTQTYIAWQWRASNATAVTNTAGSITSTVSANTTSGFSIISYTGNGTTGATVGHGLGAAPKFLIWKPRASVTDWMVWHIGLSGYNYDVRLNTTTGQTTGADPLNNTAPSSTVITLRNQGDVNGSGTSIICYAFAAVAGYSAFGSYTGNGSTDGPFVYLGFRPRWLMYKRTDATGGNWNIVDVARNPYNQLDTLLRANLSNADETNSVYAQDFISNGWKIRSTNQDINTNAATYIYAAFAEFPFKTALAR